MNRNDNYATLGQSCQCSMAVLTDNRKFFPLNEPDYNLVFTRFYRYPGPSTDQLPTIGKHKRPEELKTGSDSVDQEENFKCCGSSFRK